MDEDIRAQDLLARESQRAPKGSGVRAPLTLKDGCPDPSLLTSILYPLSALYASVRFESMTIFVSEETSTRLLGIRTLHGRMAQGCLPSN